MGAGHGRAVPRARRGGAGDLGGALDRIAGADPDDRRLGDPFERARTRLVEGTLLRRAKKRGAARTAIEGALAGFTAIGTPLWADRARAELERLGLRPSAGALTETESRIAALAASGATNREIAGLMFVSVKTVEANLSRCYRKLGVRSRVELARRLERDEERTPGGTGGDGPTSNGPRGVNQA